MNISKRIIALLCACLMLTFTACSDRTAVYVQSVKNLTAMGGIAPGDRFAGVVVSENVTEIKKDSDKGIKELLVKEGDDVTEGQALFSYDTDELQINLDRQKLELDQMYATIQSYQSQIAQLEQERNKVGEASKLQYTIEIQSAQPSLKEAQLSIKNKEAQVKQAQELLNNSTVVSPINGRIQSINESGMNNYGEPAAYITIQQSGSYRIKGTLNELQRGGIVEGSRIKISSRTDDSLAWYGTVTLVDYESPYQGSDYDNYYGTSSDEMTSSSKYPFYVEPDSTEGLILGQHIYMTMDTEEDEVQGISISSAFICYNDNGEAYVWTEKRGKLEMRMVELGEYNMMNDTQIITSGLSTSDYIAFPDPAVCVAGAPTTHEVMAEDSYAADDMAVGEMAVMN